MRNKLVKPPWKVVLFLILGLASCQLTSVFYPAESVSVSSGPTPGGITGQATAAIAAGEETEAFEPSPVPTRTRSAPTKSDPEERQPDPTETASPVRETGRCAAQESTLIQFSLRSRVLEEPLRGRMYLPSCYGQEGEYPVLYLFHGLMATEEQWLELGIQETADALIQEERISPLVIVMPREEDWGLPPDNLFGQAVIQELIPWVDEH